MDANQVKIAYGLADRHFNVTDFMSYGMLAAHLTKERVIEYGRNVLDQPIITILEDFSISACVGSVTTFTSGTVLELNDNVLITAHRIHCDIEHLYQSCK